MKYAKISSENEENSIQNRKIQRQNVKNIEFGYDS